MLSVPIERRNVQAEIGGVKYDVLLHDPVVERDRAAAVDADEELVQCAVTVVAPGLIRRDSVNAPESLGLERQVRADLTPHEESAGPGNRGEPQQPRAARPKRWEIGQCSANHGQCAPTFRLNIGTEGGGRGDGPDARCAGRRAPQTRMGT